VFYTYVFCTVLTVNNVNQLIFVIVKCGVLSEVRAKFINVIETSVVFKGLGIHGESRSNFWHH
jgi:hypothetical protein